MVDFVEKLNFLSSIQQAQNEEQYSDFESSHPKIVGQERNGIILYTWHSISKAKASKRRTHVSMYDATLSYSRMLFTHNDDIEIVNASVNQDRVLLAFTVKQMQPMTGNISPGDPVEIFKSYIAEIAPQNRVFSLNIEWHSYQKVQFLHNSKPSAKKIHMLFIHHKESIGLYHIPLAKLGDNGYIMSSQPKIEQVVRQFLWCQFDPLEQRLSFIQLNSQDEEDIDGAGMFSVIQFLDQGEFKYILNFQLPLSFKMELMRETVKYYNSYLSQTVANKNLNIEVLTASRGGLFICYQHFNEGILESSENARPSPDDDTVSVCSVLRESSTIEYTICCIHGSYAVNCVVSLDISKKPLIEPRLFFSLFGDYIAVYLPDGFLHLLDCGSEHKPLHHILLSDDEFFNFPADSGALLSAVYWDYIPASQHAMLLFDNKSQVTYKATFNYRTLIKLFSKTQQSSTRLALLHCAIVHIKDSVLSKRFIECLCQDPANLECIDLLKEYLIAYSYANMKRQLDKLYLLTLPISCLEPFRGHIEQDHDLRRVVIIKYKKFRLELVDILLKLLRKRESEFWNILRENIIMSQDVSVRRFPINQLMYAGLQIEPEHPLHVPSNKESSPQAKQDIKITVSEPKKEPSKDSQAKLYQRANSELQYQDKMIMQIVVDKVSAHILKCFPKENKSKVNNICIEYASCRGRVVKSLWRHLSKVFDYESENDVLQAPLEATKRTSDHALFQMLERLHTCLALLCFPEFREMPNVFISLAYRCLSRHLFLQYLNARVFTVRTDFVKRFIAEVPDKNDLVPIKIELITKLPKSHAKAALLTWDHPVAKRFITHELVARFDGDITTGSHIMASDSKDNISRETEQFLPLETFLRTIKVEGRSRQFGAYPLTEQELNFIEETALEEMNFLSIDFKR